MGLMKKSRERSQIDLTDLDAHTADELANYALAFVDRSDRMASDPERRLLLANTLATLAVYKELASRQP